MDSRMYRLGRGIGCVRHKECVIYPCPRKDKLEPIEWKSPVANPGGLGTNGRSA